MPGNGPGPSGRATYAWIRSPLPAAYEEIPETMAVWETETEFYADSPSMTDYAQIWKGIDKIVYSRTLTAPVTARTRIEQDFDPEAIRQLKRTAERDISIGGPELAAHAFRAGLVDEIQHFIFPVVVGGGKPALPEGLRLTLELLDERRFGNGAVYLRYRIA